MNLDEQKIKKTYQTGSSQEARDIVKNVADTLDYSFQEMNSIAAAYNGSKEAIVKNGDRIEAYCKKAQEKIEEIIEN